MKNKNDDPGGGSLPDAKDYDTWKELLLGHRDEDKHTVKLHDIRKAESNLHLLGGNNVVVSANGNQLLEVPFPAALYKSCSLIAPRGHARMKNFYIYKNCLLNLT